MTTEVYSSFVDTVRGADAIAYSTATPSVTYPEADMFNVLGPVMLPRVYGKDLSSFEVASSGRIALTVRDVYSLSFDRDSASNIVNIAAVSNDSLRIAANSSNMFLDMDSATNDVKLYAANNLTLASGGGFAQEVGGDLTYSAGGVFTARADSNVAIVSQSNDVVATAFSNVFVTATNGEIKMTAGTDFAVIAVDDASIAAGAGKISVDPTRVAVEAYTGTLQIAAYSNEIAVTAASNVTIAAGSNFAVTAANNASIASGAGAFSVDPTRVAVEAYTGTLQIAAHSNEMTVTAASNITVASGGSFAVTASNDASIQADAGKVAVDGTQVLLEAYTGKVLVAADSNTVDITAASNLSLSTAAAAALAASNAVAVTAGTTATLQSVGKMTVTSTTGDVALAAPGASLTLSNDSNIGLNAAATVGVTANTSVVFGVAGNNILSLTGTKATLLGDLDIAGTLNSINTTQVQVEDKTITLAYAADLVDGAATNDSTGLVIHGLPEGVTTDPDALYEKSFKWRINGGLSNLGTDDFAADPCFEMRGGALKLTHRKTADGKDISYSLRIHETTGSLEVVRRVFSATSNAYVTKRVAVFGRAIA